jgi:quinol monooxygenase YgiN
MSAGISRWTAAELRSLARLDRRGRLAPRETMKSMSQEILSVAIFQPLPGYEEASLSTMRSLIAALDAGGYSRDLLYRDAKSRDQYILLRHWKSEESRRAALEDPEVLRCWAKLAQEIRTVKVYETLEEALAQPPG